MSILRTRFGGLIRNRRQYTITVFSVWRWRFLSLSNVPTITKWTECGRNVLVYSKQKTMRSFRKSVFWVFLNLNRNSQNSPKVICLMSLFFHLCTHFKTYPARCKTLAYSHLKSQTQKCFSENLCKANWETELSIMKYIVRQSQFVGMSWRQNPLFVINRNERDIAAAILVAKFTCT